MRAASAKNHVVVVLMSAILGAMAPAVGAQGVLDRIKQAAQKVAEDAKKVAEAKKAVEEAPPQGLKLNTPYSCPDGTTIVVEKCEQVVRGGVVRGEICWFQTHKGEQDLGPGYGPRQQVETRVQSCKPSQPGTGTPSSQQSAGPAGQKSSTARVEARVVAPASAANATTSHISPRGAHMMTVVQRGSRWVVTHDGVDGPRFDEIFAARFSPDGERYAYVARAGEEYVAMVDGKELNRVPRAGATPLTLDGHRGPIEFSANSKHVYFSIQHSGSGRNEDHYCQLYVNGQPSPRNYPSGGFPCKPIWSPDGSRYALIINPVHTPGPAGSGSPLQLMIDGKPAGYPSSGFSLMTHLSDYGLKFTADGRHLFVKASQTTPSGLVNVMFMDGKPWIKAQDVSVHIPPVGNRVVAVVSSGEAGKDYHQFLHVDGKKVSGSECFAFESVHFSSDGRRYAARCRVQANKGEALLVDGRRGQEYDQIQQVSFTPDSSRAVYVARMGQQYFVVAGDQESDGYQRIVPQGLQPDPEVMPVAFGAGGKRMAFMVHTAPSGCGVVVDGQLLQVAPRTCHGQISFSPDGAHWAAFMANEGLIVDGTVRDKTPVPFESWPKTIPFVFSPDGNHLVHLTANAPNVALVIDGRAIALPSGKASIPTFTPDGRHFLFATLAGHGFPAGRELVVYVDGRPAARFPGGAGPTFPWVSTRSSIADAQASFPAWEMGADGVLTFLVQDGNDANAVIKRVRITPSADTNIDMMLGEMRQLGRR